MYELRQHASVMVFGCTHIPLNDDSYTEWLMEEIERRQPDVLVHAGDLLEADAASRWPSEYDWTLRHEFEEANAYLARINRVYKGRKVFLAGNHDANVVSINRIDTRLRDLVDPQAHLYQLDDWECHWDYEYDPSRTKGVFQVGWLTVMHGYEAGVGADEHQACLMANPYGLYVGVHTHKPVCPTQARKATIPLPFWYANAGCGRTLNPEYVKRKRTHQWGQAYVWVETAITTRMEYDARQKWGLNKHPMWDAETVIYRMAGEEGHG